jgi:hypothetical protein
MGNPPREPDAGSDVRNQKSRPALLAIRTSHVLLIGFLALFATAFSYFPVWHTDVWAHLRFGQEIVRDLVHSHRLPQHEPFPESMANKEAQYIHYQWIAQAGGYLLYEAGAALSPPDADHRLGGGALFLVTAHALILVLRFGLLYVAFHRLSDSPAVALLGVVLVCGMGLFVHLYILRPQILGELAFAALLVPLSRPLLSRRALVLVPLVFLLWANCHATFVMGFVLLGAVTAGRAIEVVGLLAPLRAPIVALRALVADQQFRRLMLLLPLSVLATLANPHGPYLLYNSYLLSQTLNIQTMEEWKPLPLQSAVHAVFLGSVLLLAVLLRLSPRRFTPAQVLLLLGFGLQSVAHARMVVWWIMVFAWVVVPHLRAVADRFGWTKNVSLPSLLRTLVAVAIVVALLVLSRPAVWLLWRVAPTAELRVTPVTPVHVLGQIRQVDAARDLAARLSAQTPLQAVCLSAVSPRPHVIFVSETLGDYLLWDLREGWEGPPVRLSCYSHVHLFSEKHWKQCMQVKLATRGWQQGLDDMGADFLVLEDELYDQERRKNEGKAPGFSDLIDRVRRDGRDRWQVLSAEGDPIFIAQRIR